MKTYQKQIDATHPMEDSAGDAEMAADALAMKLVGERHEKRDLVNLVRWLILRAGIREADGPTPDFYVPPHRTKPTPVEMIRPGVLSSPNNVSGANGK